MNAFLATLSAAASGNWEICKRHRLWGTGTSSHARGAAVRIRPGDVVYVWQSGRGLLAKAEAKSAARQPRIDEVPWPDPARYSYIFDIDVLAELRNPIADRFKEHRSVRFGIRTHELQSGFISISADVAAALEDAVGGRMPSPQPSVVTATDQLREETAEPTESPVVPIATPTDDAVRAPGSEARWGRPLAGVYLRPASSITEALLALYRRVADDQDGELLIVGDERDRGAVENELRQPPFSDIRHSVRFVTGAELASEIARRFSARPDEVRG
jgi:hypothetical protein